MKRLERLIDQLVESKFWTHAIFCLLFTFLFSIPVVLSGNKGIGRAALFCCLFILVCTYAGRWSGKLWLSGRVHSLFLLSLPVSMLGLSLVGAAGSAYVFRGNIPTYFVPYLVTSFPVVVLFVFLGLAAALVRNSLLRQISEARLQQQHRESELRLLLSQLSPHFLFNTLNNLYGISLTQHQRVPQLLLKLSELLRYSVYETRERFIPLKNELLYLNNYIDFEKIQTGERLRLESQLADVGDSPLQIPPMVLIVFIENAFKHSKNTRAGNLSIAISLQLQGDWIRFTVKNSYDENAHQPTSFSEPSGVGLGHTLKRLDLIYGNDYVYQVKKEKGLYSVELQLKANKP